MYKISIIIPSYKSEEFICECLDSCLEQDISQDEYEIIIVNDCSPDNCIERACIFYNSYNGKKPPLQVINTSTQKSMGASIARNIGLKQAKGEYLWFVDSDDKIEKNCLGHLLSIIRKNQVDILRFNFYFWKNKDYSIMYNVDTTLVTSGWNLYVAHPRPIGIWSAIWRRDYLLSNNLFFLEGFRFEDEEFMPKAQYLAARAMMIATPYYYYRQHDGSVMKSKMDTQKVLSYIAVCNSLYDFRNTMVKPEHAIRFDEIIAFCFTQAISLNSHIKEAVDLSILKHQPFYPLSNVNGVKYWLVNHSLVLAHIIYRIRFALFNCINRLGVSC